MSRWYTYTKKQRNAIKRKNPINTGPLKLKTQIYSDIELLKHLFSGVFV